MDRYIEFGLRGEEDELLRRAVRDGLKRAGLGHAQLTQALEWYKDHVRPGMDETALMASFHEFSAAKGWDAEKIVAACSVYSQIRDVGPEAVLDPTDAATDRDLIARADQLLRTDGGKAYWSDEALQELVMEARERQLAAPAPAPDRAVVADQIERQIAQRNVDKFAEMLRKEPAKYWASPELQRQHHEAIAAAIRETPQPVAQPAAAPSPPVLPLAAPAAPVPAKTAVSDAARRTEIEALMRVDGGNGYWRDPAVQREYGQVLARLAGEAPPLAPASVAPEGVPMSPPAEGPPQDAACD